MPETGEVTLLLQRWSSGDAAALEQLLPLVYGELQRLAGYHLRRERVGQTLQTTAVVHEAYLKLAGQQAKEWKNRGHFLAVCSQLLRQVLVDQARMRQAAKRGPGSVGGDFEVAIASAGTTTDGELLALNQALAELARLDPLKAQIVDLKYFGGFNVEEIAQLLSISTPTVKRYWAMAKAWLFQQLREGRR
ncbi:MAG: sigma-70 family RNA polymerase sigma factor [Bryobacterales bacterium]|nr:sigma-70 family RNA polymerase sigma factor [Bryobacterales bacterium]